MEERYCSYCGNRLEPDARFCSSCGRPVHRAPPPEADAPTSQLPTSEPPTSQMPASPPPSPPPSPSPPRPPQYEPRAAQAPGGTAWQRVAEARGGGISWPMLALVGVFLALVVVEASQEGIGGAIRVALVVAAVVLVASAVSYLSLARRGTVTLRGAVFNWSVVVLAAAATILFLIS